MDTTNLVHLGGIYATATGRSLSTVGRLAAGHGAFFDRLERGCDITTRRVARVVQWFSDNWPPGHPWPMGIPRPEPTPGSPAAAPAPGGLSPDEVLSAVRDCLARESALLDDPDFSLDAVQAVQAEMAAAALTLGPDGEIASGAALCEALKVPRQAYHDVIRTVRRGGRPKSGNAKRIHDALLRAGDARVAGRAA